jgi:hypothetical protein
MANIELNTEWIKVVEQAPKKRDFFVEVSGGVAYLGKAPSASRRTKRELKNGDRGKIEVPAAESVFARAESGTLTLSVERDNFSLKLFPREEVGASISDTVDISDDQSREIGKARVMDSTGTLVDPLDSADLPLNVDTVPTAASTNDTGSNNAASIDAAGLSELEVLYDTTGSATITVEVSQDSTNWYERATFSPSSAVNLAEHLPIGIRYVRAYADSNLNELEISAKGV